MCKFYILAFVAVMAIVSCEVHGKNSEAPAPKDKAPALKEKAPEPKEKAPAPEEKAPAPKGQSESLDGSFKTPPKKSHIEPDPFYKRVRSSEGGGVGPPEDLTQPELNDVFEWDVKNASTRATLIRTLHSLGFESSNVKHLISAEHLTPNYLDYLRLGYKRPFDPAFSTHIKFEYGIRHGHLVCSAYSWTPHSFYYYWTFTCSSPKGSFGFFGKSDKIESDELFNVLNSSLGSFGVKIGNGHVKSIKSKLKYHAPGVDSVYELQFLLDYNINCHLITAQKEGSLDLRNVECRRYYKK